MSIENSSNRALELTLLALGILFLGFFHFFALHAAPGLHFDEAWAMNFAHRIAFEPGFWPLTAQSPYTSPWAHYWAALWLKLLGPSLYVFRFSQVILSLAGLLCFCVALWRRGYERAACWLPLMAALLPGLVLNHRFAIELNGFHAFCFGLMVLGLGLGRVAWLTALAWVIGSSSHILFFAVGLALLAAIVWEKREIRLGDRWCGGIASLALAAFFFRVFLLIPEKGKGLALFLVALFAAFGFFFPPTRWLPRPRWIDSFVGLVAFTFLANAVFFLEGSWSVALSTGLKAWRGLGGAGVVLFCGASLWLTYTGSREVPRFARRWFLLGVIVLGAMMLKPAPRYYECALLGLAVFLSLGVAALRPVQRWAVVFLFVLHAAWLYPLYVLTTPKEESLRFVLWKDSSRDFLSKQSLVAVLGGSGCQLSDIKTVDSRVREALQALSYGDWPVKPGGCLWKELNVARRGESSSGTHREEAADFVLWGIR